LTRLLDSPSVKKLYSQKQAPPEPARHGRGTDEYQVIIHDHSATSAINQLKKKKTMAELMTESEKRKAKNVMHARLH